MKSQLVGLIAVLALAAFALVSVGAAPVAHAPSVVVEDDFGNGLGRVGNGGVACVGSYASVYQALLATCADVGVPLGNLEVVAPPAAPTPSCDVGAVFPGTDWATYRPQRNPSQESVLTCERDGGTEVWSPAFVD